jgi:uncharacterized GH25 family protein
MLERAIARDIPTHLEECVIHRASDPRRMRRAVRWLCVVSVASALAGSSGGATAHEYWLAPSSGRAAKGDTVVVRAVAGTGFRGEFKPFNHTRTLRLTYEAAAPVSLTPLGVSGETQWARVVPTDDRGAMLTYVSDATSIELPAADFDRYLALEGLDAPLAARAALGATHPPGREIYRRSCKAWLAGSDATRATRTYGLPLEIVPDADPLHAATLSFRVLDQGKPLAHALVRAWRQPLAGAGLAGASAASRDSVGPVGETRTDASGRGRLTLGGAGEWLVSTVHMVPNDDHVVSDWESTWGSLWFVRPASAGGRAR